MQELGGKFERLRLDSDPLSILTSRLSGDQTTQESEVKGMGGYGKDS